MENYKWIILAACAQAFLTIALVFVLAGRRRRAFVARQVGKDAMLNDRSWPDTVLQASNSFKSQFEIPVLFYAAIAIALATGITSIYFAVLSWLFFGARVIHAVVHCSSNALAPRFSSFLVSVIAASAMWGVLAWRMLVGA